MPDDLRPLPDAQLHLAMPATAYHADPAPKPSLSSGIAKLLLSKSPSAARLAHPRLNPHYVEGDRSKFDIGTTAHALLLEGNTDSLVIVDAADWRTNATKEARAAAHAEGKTALLAHQATDVLRMVEAAKEYVLKSDLADPWVRSSSEQTIVWREGDIWARARLDRLTDDRSLIVDYKTTGDASPKVFSRQYVSLGYHIQEAFYRRAVRTLGYPDPAFVFLAQETEAPYECSLHDSNPQLAALADAEVERAIGIWRECMTSGEWPGYGTRVHSVVAPYWLQMEHEGNQDGI